jgi:hypothetical protein
MVKSSRYERILVTAGAKHHCRGQGRLLSGCINSSRGRGLAYKNTHQVGALGVKELHVRKSHSVRSIGQGSIMVTYPHP